MVSAETPGNSAKPGRIVEAPYEEQCSQIGQGSRDLFGFVAFVSSVVWKG